MAYNAGSIVAQLELNTNNFNQGIMAARTQIGSLTSQSATMGDKISAVGAGMVGVGKSLTMGLTVPIAGIGAASLNTAANFEAAMSEVKAISGATGEDFDALKAKANELGATTAFSASEAAEGMKYLAMAGMGTNSIIAAMPGLLDLAAASGTDLGTTSDIVSDALTAFGMSADETGHLADVMAIASSKANTNVQMLGESYKYVAPVAGAFNYTAEETTAVLAVMADSGIKARQAGTSLRGALLRMSEGAGSAGEWMSRLGIEMANADGTMKPLGDVIGQLKSSFAELTEEEKANAASALFGKNAISGMLAVINDDAGKVEDLTEMMNNADGAAADMAATMLDNLKGSFTLLKSAIEGMAISIGEYLIPYVRMIADWINKWVTAFNNLDEGTKQTIVKIGLIVAAIGPLLMIVGKVVTIVGALPALLTALTGPVGLVVMAVVALIAIFVKLYQTNEDFRNKVNAIWADIKQFGIDTFNQLKDAFADIWEQIKLTIEFVWGKIQEFWNKWGDEIMLYFETMWNILKATVEAAINIIKDIIGLVLAVIRGDWDEAWERVKSIFQTFVDWIEKVLGIFLNFWKEIWDKVKTAVIDKWEQIKADVRTKVQGLVDMIKGFFGTFVNVGRDIFNSVWDGLKGVWTNVKSWVSDKVSWIADKLAFWKKSDKEMDKSSSNASEVETDGYAQGTMNARAGWRWVGENGPELMKFSGGEKVLPNNVSQAVMSAFGGTTSLGTDGGGADLSSLATLLKKMVALPREFKFQFNMDGATIRDDSDVQSIAEVLFRMFQDELRGAGAY